MENITWMIFKNTNIVVIICILLSSFKCVNLSIVDRYENFCKDYLKLNALNYNFNKLRETDSLILIQYPAAIETFGFGGLVKSENFKNEKDYFLLKDSLVNINDIVNKNNVLIIGCNNIDVEYDCQSIAYFPKLKDINTHECSIVNDYMIFETVNEKILIDPNYYNYEDIVPCIEHGYSYGAYFIDDKKLIIYWFMFW